MCPSRSPSASGELLQCLQIATSQESCCKINGLTRVAGTSCWLYLLNLQPLVLCILLYTCIHAHLCVVMSLSFCLQITLPGVPFKGQTCNYVNIWCWFEKWGLHECILFWKVRVEKKRLNMQRGRRSGAAACSTNMAFLTNIFVWINRKSCSFSMIIRPAWNEEEGVFPPSR